MSGPQVPDADAAPTALRVRPLPAGSGARVSGEVSFVTHRIWEQVLGSLAKRDGDLHLELGGLSFIDIRGVTLLVAAAHRMEGERRVILHTPPPALSRILDTFWPTERAIVSASSAPGRSRAHDC